jgi:hypothetical protein
MDGRTEEAASLGRRAGVSVRDRAGARFFEAWN